ncbi:hypothetical protein ACLOJK_028678 [Asimina triloba]
MHSTSEIPSSPSVTSIIDGMGSVGAALGPLLTGYISGKSWNGDLTMVMVAALVAGLLLTRLVMAEVAAKIDASRANVLGEEGRGIVSLNEAFDNATLASAASAKVLSKLLAYGDWHISNCPCWYLWLLVLTMYPLPSTSALRQFILCLQIIDFTHMRTSVFTTMADKAAGYTM